jgi:meso-butanediol dehydrogenase/(S,S)-butanediol dehydrogenase/diacetyl reductase
VTPSSPRDHPARFTGKVALLTGAASGIGRAVALRLSREGASVFGLDIDAKGLEETRRLASEHGSTLQFLQGDVSDPAQCRAAVHDCVSAFGRLDVLGNIAGVARAEHFLDVEEPHYRQMMGVNVDGYVWMCQNAIPHLLETGGNIVNIASNAGLMGQGYTVVYCMTKGAVVQLTRALAMEYVKTPVRVNALAPGGIETNLSANFQIPADVDFSLMARYSGFREMGHPDDVAALFAFVASDEGANIHGAILSTDGGITAG